MAGQLMSQSSRFLLFTSGDIESRACHVLLPQTSEGLKAWVFGHTHYTTDFKEGVWVCWLSIRYLQI